MRNNQGFIRLILTIVIALFLLSHFNIFDVREHVTVEEATSVWGEIKNIFLLYVWAPIVTFWNEVVVNIVWEQILEPLFTEGE